MNKYYSLKTNLHLIKDRIKRKRDMYIKYLKYEDKNSIDLPALKYTPLISVIIYGDDNIYQCLNSLKSQTNYTNFELIIVSDKDIECQGSVTIVDYGCDKATAFKNGLQSAKGDYVAFADSTMLFSDVALYYMARQLMYEDFDIVYCDEDIIEQGNRKCPFFKPGWSPHTLREFNYIGFALIKRTIIDSFKGYYDMLVELSYRPLKVANTERILVHRLKADIEENNRKKNKVNDMVSIVIPSKDNYTVLKRCIDSIRNKTDYDNYEIIVVDNGSTENIDKIKSLADIYIYEKMEFNFSYMCNIGAERARGKYLLFLNDDTEVISSNWLEKMADYASEKQTGAVGCKLLYPNDTIQHCGVISKLNEPIHPFSGISKNTPLYFGRDKYAYNYIAVTGACLMIDKEKFDGFNTEFPLAYNDIDFCFSLMEKGYYNVCVNSVSLYHYESVSRGDDRNNSEKLKRLFVEKRKLYNSHPGFTDKFYNRNLTKHGGDFSVEDISLINRGKFAKAVMNPDRYYSDKIKYEVDYVQKGDMFTIGGYAYIDGAITNTYIVVMTRSDVAVPIKANVEPRMDLSVEKSKKYSLCGFTCNIDTNMFESGNYRLGIMLEDVLTRKKYIRLINKSLEILL